MIYLFKTENCPACQHLAHLVTNGALRNYASHVKFVDVKFNEDKQCNIAYIDGEATEGECPVDVVPAAYFKETDKLVFGLESIKENILNGLK